MNHRVVSTVVTLIVALFVVVALMFAWVIDLRVNASAALPTAAAIPHPTAGEAAACGDCHKPSDDSLPLTHRFFGWDNCQGCHPRARRVLVPHDVSMGVERCPLCHSDPARDLGMTVSHFDYPRRQCLFCHPPDAGKSGRSPKPAGESSSPKQAITHGTSGAFENCLYCHAIGGTPPMPSSHWVFELETCLWCHETASSGTTSTPTP